MYLLIFFCLGWGFQTAGITPAAVAAATPTTTNATAFSDMHMGDNEIGDEGLERLAHSLRRNRSVRLLELCFNRITGAGVEVFAKCLWGSMTLRALRFDNNQVRGWTGWEGAAGGGESLCNVVYSRVIFLIANQGRGSS